MRDAKRRRRFGWLWSACALMLALVLATSCVPENATDAPVLVLGLDGLEWDVVLPLLSEGRMPALEALMRRGSYGLLTTQTPAKSPVVWTTVVTGKDPEKHGVLDFTRVNTNGDRVLYANTDRTTKALWNMLSESGQSCAVLGWWNTYPVEAVSGVMVAQVNTFEELSYRKWVKPGGLQRGTLGQVHPRSLEDEVFATVERVEAGLSSTLEDLYPRALPAESEADAQKWATCRWSLRADLSVRHVALTLARTKPHADLMLAYQGATDVLGHHFWRYHAPEAFLHPPSDERIRKLGDVVSRTYEHVDEFVGDMVAAMPPDSTVIVISDHGMEAKHVDAQFDEGSSDRPEDESGGHGAGPPGVLVVAGPAIRASEVTLPIRRLTRADLPVLGHVRDLTPTILALRGLPVARDMDGAVLENLLRAEILEEIELEFIDTYDTPQWLAERAAAAATESPGQDERLEQLRSLGYLDGASDGPQ